MKLRYSIWSTCLLLLGINLVELQKTMDAQGLELVENQKESLVGRKGLADKTKGMLHLNALCIH